MSELTTQKLLLAMTCVFGVVLVLISFGRQKNIGFERSTYRPNSSAAGNSMPVLPSEPAPRQARSTTNLDHRAWHSTPHSTQLNRQTKYAAGQPPVRASSKPHSAVVENYFDSSPLESSQPSRQVAKHPFAQRYAQQSQQRKQALTPKSQTWPAWPTQDSNPSADKGHVQQAVATIPVSNHISNVRPANFESPTPQPDASTSPQHNRSGALRLPANRKISAHPENQVSKAQTASKETASKPVAQPSENSPKSLQEQETKALPVDTAPVRIDKQVRKANWAEIDVAPTPDVRTARPPLQQISLPKQRATPQIEAKAHEQVRYGQSLARRKAFFAAREELIRTLLLIASSYRTEAGPHAYPERFAQALVALDEAGSLMNFTSDTNSAVLQRTLLSHQTRLLSPQDIQTVTPMKAIGIYSSFAQSQIEQAIGMSVAGSEALHALGKLESIVPETNLNQARTNQAKTLVFYRAAININPSNTICANDLGVLLYEMGRLQEAEYALKASLNSTQTQVTWNNLALVHRQLAANASTNDERNRQLSLANSAGQQAERHANAASNDSSSDGQWATATEFQNNAAFPNVVLQKATNRPASSTPQTGVSNSAKLKQKLKEWF